MIDFDPEPEYVATMLTFIVIVLICLIFLVFMRGRW